MPVPHIPVIGFRSHAALLESCVLGSRVHLRPQPCMVVTATFAPHACESGVCCVQASPDPGMPASSAVLGRHQAAHPADRPAGPAALRGSCAGDCPESLALLDSVARLTLAPIMRDV
eukprot:jgi/Ulvmu1/9874/UM057_0029.1